jgi:hypothetical protein
VATAIRVDGLRETIRSLERFGVATEDLKEAFGAISRDVATEAGVRVKVDTGALRATIRPARTKNKAVVRAGTAGVPYAGVVNYGRDGMAGDGFLTIPANSNTDAKVRQIEQNLQQLIVKYQLR